MTMDGAENASVTDVVLVELGQRIRQIDKKIQSVERERAASSRPQSSKSRPVSSRPMTASSALSELSAKSGGAETSANFNDIIIELQTERQMLATKYETLNNGDGYKPTLSEQLYDFCESFYKELERDPKDSTWIGKYYHPQARLNVVGFQCFEGREVIARTLIKKYGTLPLHHSIVKISIDAQSGALSGDSKSAFLCATLTVKITIGDDEPRLVQEIIEWSKATEQSPFPWMIVKEYFVVQDARPLYHFPELETPQTKVDMLRQAIADRKADEHRKKIQQELEEVEAKRRKEEEDEEDEDEEDEDENIDEDEGGAEGEEGAGSGDGGEGQATAIDDGASPSEPTELAVG